MGEIKLTAQDVWRLDIEWDDRLPDHMVKRIEKWASTFQDIHLITIPRCVRPLLEAENVLVTFCDAASPAQAACCFLVQIGKEQSHSALVASKLKLTSVNKPEPIPRFELIGGVLAVKLSRKVGKALNISTEQMHF